MLRKIVLVAAPTLVLFASFGVAGDDWRRSHRASAQLLPTEEVPALSSPAKGRFKAVISDANQTIAFELSYDDLEAAPLFAHIHVGQRRVNGGISVFLCGPAANAAELCPASPATVTGVLTPANIIGPVGQGIDPATDQANGFEELVRLLRSGDTYANVHTTKFPGGEIRGQIRPDRR
ncbi:MAG: CHRD domain-containing protein [Steroidobacter sp.]